jgi:hypothetical protein
VSFNVWKHLQKMHPNPPPKNHLTNSWNSMLSAPPWPKFYLPKFRNWPNFSPRMTSACLYPQVHDFLIRCYRPWKFLNEIFKGQLFSQMNSSFLHQTFELKHMDKLSFLEKKCHNFLLRTLFCMNKSIPYSLWFIWSYSKIIELKIVKMSIYKATQNSLGSKYGSSKF